MTCAVVNQPLQQQPTHNAHHTSIHSTSRTLLSPPTSPAAAPPNCDSFYLNNRVMLGKCYLRVKDKANAREWLTKALSMPVTDAEGKSDNAEAVAMLKQC